MWPSSPNRIAGSRDFQESGWPRPRRSGLFRRRQISREELVQGPASGTKEDTAKRMTFVVTWKSFLLILVSGLLLSASFGQTTGRDINAITSALRGREFDKALQLLQPALQEFPKSPQLWMLKGLAYAGKGNQKDALASYQSALKNS